MASINAHFHYIKQIILKYAYWESIHTIFYTISYHCYSPFPTCRYVLYVEKGFMKQVSYLAMTSLNTGLCVVSVEFTKPFKCFFVFTLSWLNKEET